MRINLINKLTELTRSCDTLDTLDNRTECHREAMEDLELFGIRQYPDKINEVREEVLRMYNNYYIPRIQKKIGYKWGSKFIPGKEENINMNITFGGSRRRKRCNRRLTRSKHNRRY